MRDRVGSSRFRMAGVVAILLLMALLSGCAGKKEDSGEAGKTPPPAPPAQQKVEPAAKPAAGERQGGQDTSSHRIVFVIGEDSYTADGRVYPMDVAPFIEGGRTFVPVRYLALALGVAEEDIVWVGATGEVRLSLGGTTLSMKLGSRTLTVNGRPTAMDVAPMLRDKRTYLPARYVAEAFGYEVGFHRAGEELAVEIVRRLTTAK
ncbi:MAG: copper amine oxidase N-terminal domain-containing protein [Syntrophomonadaceae bacterium]|nr:copper amine oxidase N-terminal domain-containing protein [Syntrophomonadaceae bacterium]